jgi:hypothetical protein
MLSKYLHAKRLIPHDGWATQENVFLDTHILLSNPLWSKENEGSIHVGIRELIHCFISLALTLIDHPHIAFKGCPLSFQG